MNVLVVHIFIILLNLIILVNLTTAAAEIGGSACRYSGFFDPENFYCHKDVVKLKYLPQDCTSFFYDGVTCKHNFEIQVNSPKGLEHLRSLLDFNEKDVFLFYRQENLDNWFNAIFFEDHSLEVQQVKKFIDEYAVGGLILKGLESPSPTGEFYQNFTAYVTAIKTELPNLKIGLYLSARAMILNKSDPVWFDFSKMNDILDFYIIEFASFNVCIDELLRSGITPLESIDPNINTLNKFEDALKLSTIAKEKIYFELLISPTPKDFSKLFSPCILSYNEYCENQFYEDKWCIDNQDTLYEKGLFAKKLSKGFIARDIDLVDRDLKCKCHKDKYITFNMLLNGYRGADIITCDRLKVY